MDFVQNVGKKRMLNNMDFTPFSKSMSKDELLDLLSRERINKICFHKWVYWKFGDATKQHRCCKKCYKKQKSNSVLYKTHSRWIEDNTINIR